MEVNASVGGERRGHSHLISMSEIGIDMEHGYILYIYIYITAHTKYVSTKVFTI